MRALFLCFAITRALVTPWDALSMALKNRARDWFIERATDKGIDWTGKTQFYEVRLDEYADQTEPMHDCAHHNDVKAACSG
jgi:hypothetical protein